jgi:Cation transporter/ATPase, N-terminus
MSPTAAMANATNVVVAAPSGAHEGLSTEEARQRLQQAGVNELPSWRFAQAVKKNLWMASLGRSSRLHTEQRANASGSRHSQSAPKGDAHGAEPR